MEIDKPNRTSFEAKECVLRERLKKEFPALYMDKFVLVDTAESRLAIDDISYRSSSTIQDDIESLALSCKGWVEVYDAKGLTLALAQKLRALFRAADMKRTLVIFPGNGARVVKDLLPEDVTDDLTTISIPAQRIIDTRTRKVERVELIGKRISTQIC